MHIWAEEHPNQHLIKETIAKRTAFVQLIVLQLLLG